MSALGRRIPTDFTHVEKYPYRTVMPTTVTKVNKALKLPRWHWQHDQGSEGACVGFGSSMMMSLLNKRQRYNPWWLWNESKKIDEWSDTNPGDSNGTSVRAACDVLRVQGHSLWNIEQPSASEGITANRWATTVDEMRTSIASGVPMSIGINWYANFDSPERRGLRNWIGRGDLGQVRGGHCVCVYGASDRLEAFKIKNSWGANYPLVWIPYLTMQRLISEYGEVTLVSDR